ncbi:hypothetical protein Daus18300_009519 [Diaporthe australafricana]|uniref:Aminoglycoside phosphotransferase domain-containing protein n=1 Tax=Diaporthe australafricana TaxID=127596 RepID=A0ABR3WE40_9PEZI
MAAPRVNHEGYARRLAVVQAILDRHGLAATSITPVEYDERSPFHYNNFLYKLDLAAPATAANFPPKPCTTAPPAEGITTLILKLSNAKAEGLNNTNRVENDVITSLLIRESLSRRASDLAAIVPAVYAWEAFTDPSPDADEAAAGWTLMEHRPGSNLDAQFAALGQQERHAVVAQVATILAAVQSAQLPPGVTGHGGMTFDGSSSSTIVTGERPLLPGGPWTSYAEMWAARLRFQLAGDAEQSPVLRGWHRNGALRTKLDAFISGPAVIEELLQRGGVATDQRVLTHGDFTMNNMLYDPETHSVSALIDFDWAVVTHPAHEFFSGLHDLQGGTHPAAGGPALQAAVLSGDFDDNDNTDTAGTTADDEERASSAWALARAWDAALREAGGLRPSSLAGITTLESLRALEDLIAPFALCSSVMVAGTPADKLEVAAAETEAKLEALLDSLAQQAGV